MAKDIATRIRNSTYKMDLTEINREMEKSVARYRAIAKKTERKARKCKVKFVV